MGKKLRHTRPQRLDVEPDLVEKMNAWGIPVLLSKYIFAILFLVNIYLQILHAGIKGGEKNLSVVVLTEAGR